MGAIICFICMLFSLLLLLYADYFNLFFGILILKTVASILFILTGYFSFKKQSLKKWPPYFKCILLGLIFSLGGDFFLALDTTMGIFFIIGLISFSLAHASYITGFFQINKFEKINLCWTLVFLAVLFLLITFIKQFEFDGLYPLVLFYGILISFMVGKSFSFWKYRVSHKSAVAMTIIGAIMFLISDTILLFAFFMPSAPSTALRISNHLIYYVGQGILALSLSKEFPKTN